MKLFGFSLANLNLNLKEQINKYPIISKIITGCTAFIGVYVIGKNDKLKSGLIALSYNLIYLYNHVIMTIERWMPKIGFGSDQGSMDVKIQKTLFFIKNNVDLIESVECSNYESTDFILQRKDKGTVIGKSNNFVVSKDSIANQIYEPFFLSIYISFETNGNDSDSSDESELKISLVTENDNFYVYGNKIDKYVLWYLVFTQHNINNYGKDYSLKYMTNSFEQGKLDSTKSILIKENTFVVL
jgi:hypothetical protein